MRLFSQWFYSPLEATIKMISLFGFTLHRFSLVTLVSSVQIYVSSAGARQIPTIEYTPPLVQNFSSMIWRANFNRSKVFTPVTLTKHGEWRYILKVNVSCLKVTFFLNPLFWHLYMRLIRWTRKLSLEAIFSFNSFVLTLLCVVDFVDEPFYFFNLAPSFVYMVEFKIRNL